MEYAAYMLRLIWLIATVAWMSTKLAFADCRPIPGANQIWSIKQVHWVFVGELHGSNEAPEAFYQLACDAVAHGRKVIVALERPTSEQNALAPVLSAKDVGPAQRKLLTEPGWLYGVDGRASEAMLRLLLSLRGLRSAHSSISVAAFDAFVGPYRREAPGERDEAIGRFLLKLGRSHPDGLVLVLTGNLHAMKEPMRGYELAAMYIPANERISLEVTDTGTGESWTESDGGCGPSKSGVGAKGQTSQRGIYLDPAFALFGKESKASVGALLRLRPHRDSASHETPSNASRPGLSAFAFNPVQESERDRGLGLQLRRSIW